MNTPRKNERVYQMKAPHFAAGVIFLGSLCIDAAPIVKWAIGKQLPWLQSYCARKGWTIQPAPTEENKNATP